MPPLDAHQSSSTTKMLFIGNNGAGKTGALASLADAGFNLRILDLDNGLDTLAKILTSAKSPYSKEAISRVKFQTLTDPMKNINGKLVAKKATVWQRTMEQLMNWKTLDAEGKIVEELGPVTSWTDREVLVIDSLSMLANAAMNFVLAMNARHGQQAHQSDWYAGQQLLEGVMQTIFDEGIKCNVIINCHIVFIGDEGKPEMGYPATLGKALSPKIGTYFNTILMAKSTGSGALAKHKIFTKSQGLIELKNSAPFDVPTELPLETGLADYFKIMRGGRAWTDAPAASPTAAPTPALTNSGPSGA